MDLVCQTPVIYIEDNALADEDDDGEYNDKSPLFDHLVIIFSVPIQVRHDTEELHPSKCCTASSWRRSSREEEDERGPGGGREVRLIFKKKLSLIFNKK